MFFVRKHLVHILVELYDVTGAICMELVRQQAGLQFLSRAISSLTKAQKCSPMFLPIVSLLLAQAEASLGAKAKWEKNLSLEWFAWPAGSEQNSRCRNCSSRLLVFC